MPIDTAPGMPYRLQECSHPWSTLHQYLPPTHSLYYSLWERTTFRQPSFTTDPFPLTRRESYMEQQHSPLERIVRLPSVLPLHALFSLAMMIHTETFDWVIFHAFSYPKKKKKKRERSDTLGKFSEVPPPSLTRFGLCSFLSLLQGDMRLSWTIQAARLLLHSPTPGNGTPECRCPWKSSVKNKTYIPYLASLKILFAVTPHTGTLHRDGCKTDCWISF